MRFDQWGVWGIGLSLCLVGCSSSSDDSVEAAESSVSSGSSSTSSGDAGSSANTGGAAGAVDSGAAQSSGAGTSASSDTSPADASAPEEGSQPDETPAVDAAANGGDAGAAGAGDAGPAEKDGEVPSEHFSFFVTSIEAIRELSGSEDGFGGDLRYGEDTGLEGADKICAEIAESAMPGAAAKGWRAFLSASTGGPNGEAVNARDRIGAGPWYDRAGRLIAEDIDGLLGTRPAADAEIVNDLPNERGEPNRGMSDVDNHDTITGSDAQGLYSGGVTCDDWTSTQAAATSTGGGGRRGGGGSGPMCGHSWPAQSGQSWIASHSCPSCAPGVNLVNGGPGGGSGIGGSGGYGGFYCFALQP